MQRNIFAWTAPAAGCPAFVSINQQTDGTFTLDARRPAATAMIVGVVQCGAAIGVVHGIATWRQLAG
jgi:hypothetical protein